MLSIPSTYQYTGGLRNADGTVPRRSQYPDLFANITTGDTAVEPPEKQEAAETALEEFIDYSDKYELSATNVFKAHKQAIGEWWTFLSTPTRLTDEFSARIQRTA